MTSILLNLYRRSFTKSNFGRCCFYLHTIICTRNNRKAQKNGTHRTIYWVKHKEKFEDGSVKGEKWATSVKYVGDWKMNKKCGFGI